MESIVSKSIRKPHILIVDDEVAMVRSLELLLRPLGEIIKAYSVPEAEEALQKNPKIDCIVTDVSMPEASGLILVDHIRRKMPEIPVIVMTAYSSVPQAVDAMHRGAFEYIVKPFENVDMFEVVKKAIVSKGLIQGETTRMPKGWICNSKAMSEFLVKAERSAQTDSPILLVGEVGVGKSRAARWIHDHSAISRKDFIAVDGRAHEEDSPFFSRLEKMKDRATVFVSEIYSLPRRMQDYLMDLLKAEKVRLIASSSSAPEFQHDNGFRTDLLELLQSLSLRVPSLRDRAEDFEALSKEILLELAKKTGFKKLELDSQALQLLKTHSFSGNVKELERILERAALEARAGVISVEAIRLQSEDLKSVLPFSIPIEDGWNRLELLRESLEKELIIRALDKFPQHSNTQIAAVLGTTRRILELRMKAYQMRESNE